MPGMQLSRATLARDMPRMRFQDGPRSVRMNAPANQPSPLTGPALRFFETSRSLQPARQVKGVVRQFHADALSSFRGHDHEQRETDPRQLLSDDADVGVPRRCDRD